MARFADPAPRMTLPHALRSELMRLSRSPLTAVHLVCGVVGGLACGAYFAVAVWDPAMGADAFAQFLGALMPLMSCIVCGLAVDEERAAGGLANLTSVPARGRAVIAKLLALALMGTLALAVAFGVFGVVLAAAGRLTLGALPLALAWAGTVLGSLPLYELGLALALRLGRNVAIGVGAAGMLVAFFSVGGLAHGLMTGELTGAASSVLGWVPLSWPARLASLGVELFIDATQVTGALLGCASTCAALTLASIVVLLAWFRRFEGGKADA
ncbi:ABC transporter permease [Olsenella profusa]|uniref:ABC transporter permease n=1 Tax=Olsenella profusa TaxID=138595 RepID=A0ABS2F0Y9_9ACTN|nr:ABC transporter permease [Olsenella profusa]MBM6774199.1 ABC transporter permease [Olsenella profusa]